MRVTTLSRQGCVAVLAGWIAITGLGIPNAVASATGFEKAMKSDHWIAWRVDALLQNDERFDYRDVRVAAKDGVVTLDGSVMTEYEKGHASLVAEDVPGVKGVENVILVVEPVNANFALAKKVRTQILENPELTISSLDVSAEQGRVEIRGIVSGSGERTEIGDIVKEMPGVATVENEIWVESSGQARIRQGGRDDSETILN